MKLNKINLQNKNNWKSYILPKYDVDKVVEQTKKAPTWLHFGAGNIFRAFPAMLAQNLLNNNLSDTGIICCEGYDDEIITKCFRPYDNLSVVVTLNHDGSIDKEVVASVTESLTMKDDFNRVREIFENPSLQMVSFTITEKGYSLSKGYAEDTPENCKSFLTTLVSFCIDRYKSCKAPLALVSMDNCSHNGEKLQEAVFKVLDTWYANGYVTEDQQSYIKNNISFPWTVIDKITPRPHESVQHDLESDGLEDMAPFITSKNTYIAPFVNAEKPQYLIIEDDFPNGRMALDKAGVIFTDRDTVNAFEKMKVCTCLNPLHTALAVFGCLLGFESISDEMKDKDLNAFVTKMSYKEGMPVVIDPKILDPKDFLEEVLTKRFPNPFIPDTPQRIATDTSQKLPIRFGENIKLHIKNKTADSLVLMPLVFAGWLRYLKGINDNGDRFECSSDPYLSYIQPIIQKIPFGETVTEQTLATILYDESFWGVDLKQSGLDKKIVLYFNEMNKGPHAVRDTLQKYI